MPARLACRCESIPSRPHPPGADLVDGLDELRISVSRFLGVRLGHDRDGRHQGEPHGYCGRPTTPIPPPPATIMAPLQIPRCPSHSSAASNDRLRRTGQGNFSSPPPRRTALIQGLTRSHRAEPTRWAGNRSLRDFQSRQGRSITASAIIRHVAEVFQEDMPSLERIELIDFANSRVSASSLPSLLRISSGQSIHRDRGSLAPGPWRSRRIGVTGIGRFRAAPERLSGPRSSPPPGRRFDAGPEPEDRRNDHHR